MAISLIQPGCGGGCAGCGCCFYPYETGGGGSSPYSAPPWYLSQPGPPWTPPTIILGQNIATLVLCADTSGFDPGGSSIYIGYTDTGSSVEGEYLYSVTADGIDEGNWSVGSAAGSCYLPCLFGIYGGGSFVIGVFDTFPTTLTVNGSTAITRTVATDAELDIEGSCVWTGGGYTLQYNAAGANQYYYTITDPAGNTYVLQGDQTGPNQYVTGSAVATYTGGAGSVTVQ
jgi:hypothetical protein